MQTWCQRSQRPCWHCVGLVNDDTDTMSALSTIMRIHIFCEFSWISFWQRKFRQTVFACFMGPCGVFFNIKKVLKISWHCPFKKEALEEIWILIFTNHGTCLQTLCFKIRWFNFFCRALGYINEKWNWWGRNCRPGFGSNRSSVFVPDIRFRFHWRHRHLDGRNKCIFGGKFWLDIRWSRATDVMTFWK